MLRFSLVSVNITRLSTVCWMTFQKGRIVLVILGISVPFLWLIGTFLPAKKGSRYDLAEQMAYQGSVARHSQ
jgi:hypothetical protein